MADGATEEASLEQSPAQDVSGETEAASDHDAEIDSSDEYDPSAQSFHDVSNDPPASNVTNDNLAAALNLASSTSPTPSASTPTTATAGAAAATTTTTTISATTATTAATAATNLPTTNAEAERLQDDAHPVETAPSEAPPARLPHDRIGILEDRIAEDEKGDTAAWLELIQEYKQRGKLEDARKVYDRFFAVFPTAVDERVAMVQMEADAGNKKNVEVIFNKTLKESASLKLWSTYMNHIRRYHNMTLDKSGKAAQTTYRAYQIVLEAVGQDKDSGALWQDYIAYLKTTPGTLGGTTWQDNQKMDVLRAAYQQAVVIPHQATEAIWKDYTAFENSINKQAGRKYLQDKSPEYMQARTAYSQLQNVTQNLARITLPRLPPAPGFEGHEEYVQQLAIWKSWIEWEKSDPLLIKDEDISKWRSRIVYVYKQALMALRFWPELWLNAAEFCFENDLESEGAGFLTKGIDANPESALLAFREADRLELSTTNGNDDDGKAARAQKIRVPYDRCLEELYRLLARVRQHESKELTRLAAESKAAAVNGDQSSLTQVSRAQRDDDGAADSGSGNTAEHDEQVASMKAFHKAQADQLQKTLTHVWIVLMRAFQRIQGTGNPNAKIGGARGIFSEARKRAQLTSELYAAAAMLEYHSGTKEASGKIFERGAKLYPKDGNFALEYVKYLVNVSDSTNARVVFETTVSRLQSDEDSAIKAMAKPLYAYFHSFESRYGELSQVNKLEARMKAAFPDDTRLWAFSSRFAEGDGYAVFNPTAVHQIISPGTQCRTRMQPMILEPGAGGTAPPPPLAAAAAVVASSSPRQALVQPTIISSPKRPLPADLADVSDRLAKVPRGESPLKGAAGRRQVQANAAGTPLGIGGGGGGSGGSGINASLPSIGGPPPAAPLPRDISFLLSIIPPASTYHSTRFNPEAMVRLVQGLHIPGSEAELTAMKAMHAAQAAQGGPVNMGRNMGQNTSQVLPPYWT